MNYNESTASQPYIIKYLRILVVIFITGFVSFVSLADKKHSSSANSTSSTRSKMILSRSTDPAPSSFRMGFYNKRTGRIGIFENPELVFSVNRPRNEEDEIIFECGQYQVCCVDWQKSGCTDFILECDLIGCQPTPYEGGQHGICDCSP